MSARSGESAIVVRDLRKSYGDVEAVRGVDLRVERGTRWRSRSRSSWCARSSARSCTTIVPNADAAPAIVNATVLPLLFLSDVFINTSRAPEWVQWIGKIFPVKHFAEALQSSFLPQVVPWRWTNVGIVVVWGLAGLLVAIRRFRWEPSR